MRYTRNLASPQTPPICAIMAGAATAPLRTMIAMGLCEIIAIIVGAATAPLHAMMAMWRTAIR